MFALFALIQASGIRHPLDDIVNRKDDIVNDSQILARARLRPRPARPEPGRARLDDIVFLTPVRVSRPGPGSGLGLPGQGQVRTD